MISPITKSWLTLLATVITGLIFSSLVLYSGKQNVNKEQTLKVGDCFTWILPGRTYHCKVLKVKGKAYMIVKNLTINIEYSFEENSLSTLNSENDGIFELEKCH